jgi:hypothetical protein
MHAIFGSQCPLDSNLARRGPPSDATALPNRRAPQSTASFRATDRSGAEAAVRTGSAAAPMCGGDALTPP